MYIFYLFYMSFLRVTPIEDDLSRYLELEELSSSMSQPLKELNFSSTSTENAQSLLFVKYFDV